MSTVLSQEMERAIIAGAACPMCGAKVGERCRSQAISAYHERVAKTLLHCHPERLRLWRRQIDY